MLNLIFCSALFFKNAFLFSQSGATTLNVSILVKAQQYAGCNSPYSPQMTDIINALPISTFSSSRIGAH
jgi:hypothetical protein